MKYLTTFPRKEAFSLVEVSIAIGIMAFSFVALFGLLPIGLNTFRQAMDTSVGAQIAQRVAGELQETDYFTLLASCQAANFTTFRDSDSQFGLLPRRYFDDQGSEILVANPNRATPQERQRILYEVLIRISRAPSVPLEENGNVSRMGTRNLSLLTIQIVNNPGGLEIPLTPDLLIDPANMRLAWQTFPAMIARNTSRG